MVAADFIACNENPPSLSKLVFLERGWTPEGPQEDSNEEALPAPGVKKREGQVRRVKERAARCKLEKGWLTGNARRPWHR